MERIRQKYFIYNVPIYKVDILVIYFSDNKYANKVMKKFNMVTKIEDERGAAGWEERDGLKYFYLVMRATKDDENTLVHETAHLTQDILEHVSIKFQKGKANEPYTYLQSWLYEEFKKLLNI